MSRSARRGAREKSSIGAICSILYVVIAPSRARRPADHDMANFCLSAPEPPFHPLEN